MRKTINQKMMNVSDEDGVRDILSQAASVTTIVKKTFVPKHKSLFEWNLLLPHLSVDTLCWG